MLPPCAAFLFKLRLVRAARETADASPFSLHLNDLQGLKASGLYFLLYSQSHSADKATFSQTMMTSLTLKHSSALSPSNLSLKALPFSPLISTWFLLLSSGPSGQVASWLLHEGENELLYPG